MGSGLSSSAALLVALLRALRSAFALPFDDVRLAALGQHAENNFVGAPVGIMDFMAASLGDPQHALLVDTHTLIYRQIPLPSTADLLVIDSGIAHQHSTGAYGQRRHECEQAAALLHVPLLCRLPTERHGAWAELPPPLDRRARHVITENERVLAAVTALETGDWYGFGTLLNASHASLRDDYEVSLPAIDHLVALAQQSAHVYGARLTGGGFGGSFVTIVERGWAQEVGRSVIDRAGDDGKTHQGGPRIVVPPQSFGGLDS